MWDDDGFHQNSYQPTSCEPISHYTFWYTSIVLPSDRRCHTSCTSLNTLSSLNVRQWHWESLADYPFITISVRILMYYHRTPANYSFYNKTESYRLCNVAMKGEFQWESPWADFKQLKATCCGNSVLLQLLFNIWNRCLFHLMFNGTEPSDLEG